MPQSYPQPGWVEHSAEEIWQATIEATRAVLKQVDASELTAIGITNQRETVVLWDRETMGSPRRAIVWQDRRTADICSRMRDEGHEYFREWVGSQNYEMRVAPGLRPEWIDRRILAIIRGEA